MTKLSEITVLIRGAGEIASGVAHRLHCSHFGVCLTERDNPLAVCRGTAFSEAIFNGTKMVEGITAELVSPSVEAIHRVWGQGNIPLIVDPEASIIEQLKPQVLVDAIMAKKNTGTKITDAPLVIGLGCGFYAGRDVHIVIETNHSDKLGKVIFEGEAEANTGIPVAIGGLAKERVVWAPKTGIFTSSLKIGESVIARQIVGWIGDQPVAAPLSGMLRGLLRNGVTVPKGSKIIEVDPVNDSAICNFMVDKIRTIANSVLEAIMLRTTPDVLPFEVGDAGNLSGTS